MNHDLIDTWFSNNKHAFDVKGEGGLDFWCYLRKIIEDNRYSTLLTNLSQGTGLSLGESFDCSFEKDLDECDDHTNVIFYIGLDQSELELNDFLTLLIFFTRFYLTLQPQASDKALEKLEMIEARIKMLRKKSMG